MPYVNRREFLGASLGGLTALALGAHLPGAERADAERAGADARSEPLAPETLFLTWGRDPTTTMMVQWVGPEVQGDTSLQFRPAEGMVWQSAKTGSRPFPETDLRVYRCELTGLSPGTDYRFQIGRRSPEYRFRTMPAKATDEFRFISGGDAGTGRHALESNAIAARQDPYFVFIGGDVAYDNGRSPMTVVQFLQNYSRTMTDSSGRLIPLIACLGNHDVKGGYKGRREDATSFLPLFDGFYSETSYGVLDIGDYLSLVLLDTGHLSPIDGEQTDWLEKMLAQRQERPHLFAAGHVPCYPSYRDPDAGERQRNHWCPLFERYKVDAVLEHHDHTYKRTHPLIDGRYDKHGVLYLGDGSWGKLRAPKKPEDRPYLAKTSEAYHVTLHQLQGDRRFHVALEDTGKIADITTTAGKRPARRG